MIYMDKLITGRIDRKISEKQQADWFCLTMTELLLTIHLIPDTARLPEHLFDILIKLIDNPRYRSIYYHRQRLSGY